LPQSDTGLTSDLPRPASEPCTKLFLPFSGVVALEPEKFEGLDGPKNFSSNYYWLANWHKQLVPVVEGGFYQCDLLEALQPAITLLHIGVATHLQRH
jgi:hypothetical protein